MQTEKNPLKREREDDQPMVDAQTALPASNFNSHSDALNPPPNEEAMVPLEALQGPNPTTQNPATNPSAPQQQQPTQQQAANPAPPPATATTARTTTTTKPPQPAAPTAAAAASKPANAPDTYLSREIRHIEREKSGELSVVYVSNDNTPTNMKLLIGLKNVFSKCLPNMPKTYIVRLLFDRRHRSVVIVRNDGTVIGGIAYRPFYPQRFAEIAFCAIAQSLQVSGFGTRLMNWTKHYARLMDHCEYFLTYADNNAVGYFSKQGFTKTVSMPKDRWHGYIKDYDGGTLMECYIHPTLPFINLPEMMAIQRNAVDRTVQRYSQGHVQREGLNYWKILEQQQQQNQQEEEKERNGQQYGQLPIMSIPGVVESGWSAEGLAKALPKYKVVIGGKMVDPTLENIHTVMEVLMEQLNKEEALVWPFRVPVDANEVPDYYTLIKDPIDMSEIRRKMDSRAYYVTLDIFAADVQRMFKNAEVYNAPDTVFYKAAKKLAGMFMTWYKNAIIMD